MLVEMKSEVQLLWRVAVFWLGANLANSLQNQNCKIKYHNTCVKPKFLQVNFLQTFL